MYSTASKQLNTFEHLTIDQLYNVDGQVFKYNQPPANSRRDDDCIMQGSHFDLPNKNVERLWMKVFNQVKLHPTLFTVQQI